MKRTTLSLAVAVAVLALVVGIATLTRPSAGHAVEAKPPRQVPIQRADAVCPQVAAMPGAATLYTAVTPSASSAQPGGARLAELADATKERGKLETVGKPAAVNVETAEVPALGWVATGGFAPGFTAQSTTRLASGSGRGLSGAVCQAPGTDQWFVGTSTADKRKAYLYLSNSTNVSAQVDVELYGKDGQVQVDGVRSLNIEPGKTENILLSTLNQATKIDAAAVHVLVRSGRIAAAVRDQEDNMGVDWLPQAGLPGRQFIVPGLPGNATDVTLTLFGASDTDTEVSIELVGKASTFKPAGHESATVKRGSVLEVGLGPITQGESSALKLTAARADVLVGVKVRRGTNDQGDVAFLAPTPALDGKAVFADNRAGGTQTSTMMLTAPEGNAKVRLTSTAGADPATSDVEVPGGTTVEVPVPVPAGATQFAVTVEALPGSGPVYGARMIAEQVDKQQMFTIQGMTGVREKVALPTVREDVAITVPQPKGAAK
ncbi:DUF5719 family protein [Yinghuangia seranimata]|uniref:DUF5719 family protein n=1 Tax=Yinghuangia seranimata TaxID=408067 RepID=UPI00248AC3F0|nr:DUF5719 family protein [Yinghuangia seranimata]MDI2132610.1 DUF5719 family protein [Yinghuangia seranimata]